MGAGQRLALAFSTYRAFATATKLGSAFLSGASDFAFQASARSFNGLSKRGLPGQYLKLMRPGSIEDQKLAVRRGLIAEEWASRTAAQSRYVMEEMSSEFSRRLAEGVLRVSLLARHTQTMRWVYGMETLATYTEAAGKSFADLAPKLRGALERYGMGSEDWDKLRSAPMERDRGADWIAPHKLDDQELGSRFMEMVHTETDIAVPVSDLNTRAVMNSQFTRGSAIGELGRSMFQFKSFGVSVMLAQWQRIMTLNSGDALTYMIGFLLGTTLTGALALELKSLAAGRDPRPMWDLDFLKASLLQGGGFGIFGDLLFSDQNRAGGGFAQTLAGPMVDDVQGLRNVVTAKDPRRQLVREAKGLIPGNNIWYSRLVLDRMLADQIEQMVNPAYGEGYRNQERYAREQGTSFYWRPGDTAPARAPDFSNALEEGPAQ
ncbi:MAG: hypothetical protein B7Y88_14255 [Sphingomonadales bacterium 32-64-17]|nr:MAG: hypothetical protein B7Y88_14255 [Sphingomonadales bacterium 32-64-17]